MTLEQIQERLRAAHDRIGGAGRLDFTVNQPGVDPECYVTHWYRPSPYAFETCRSIGSGTVAECLDALDRYAEVSRSRDTADVPVEPRAGQTEGWTVHV